jgi:hypothetical protein
MINDGDCEAIGSKKIDINGRGDPLR